MSIVATKCHTGTHDFVSMIFVYTFKVIHTNHHSCMSFYGYMKMRLKSDERRIAPKTVNLVFRRESNQAK